MQDAVSVEPVVRLHLHRRRRRRPRLRLRGRGPHGLGLGGGLDLGLGEGVQDVLLVLDPEAGLSRDLLVVPGLDVAPHVVEDGEGGRGLLGVRHGR